jgi:putative aminopeptidase FrvX
MRPTPRLRTAAARNNAPIYARFINPFGCFAEGEMMDKKNAAGIRIAAIGAPVRAIHFQNGESIVSST